MKLEGRRALVTGGSRGIGRAICVALAAEGASVGVNYRSGKEQAEEVVREIEAAGGTAVAIAGDVADFDQAQAAVASAIESLGGLTSSSTTPGSRGTRSSTTWSRGTGST